MWGCENFSHRRLVKEFSTKNWKRRTLEKFLRKLLHQVKYVEFEDRLNFYQENNRFDQEKPEL